MWTSELHVLCRVGACTHRLCLLSSSERSRVCALAPNIRFRNASLRNGSTHVHYHMCMCTCVHSQAAALPHGTPVLYEWPFTTCSPECVAQIILDLLLTCLGGFSARRRDPNTKYKLHGCVQARRRWFVAYGHGNAATCLIE